MVRAEVQGRLPPGVRDLRDLCETEILGILESGTAMCDPSQPRWTFLSSGSTCLSEIARWEHVSGP